MNDTCQHWNDVYQRKAADTVSWYQTRPAMSLSLIADSHVPVSAPLIDVGGGASTLVDHLLDTGYTDLTVLDHSPHALAQARARLGTGRAQRVHWCVEDVTRLAPTKTYALWHDRAVFHFLTGHLERAAYVAALERSLAPRGAVVIATFAADGPERCSGLAVMRYDADALYAPFEAHFERMASRRDIHTTPSGTKQPFTYLRLRRRD